MKIRVAAKPGRADRVPGTRNGLAWYAREYLGKALLTLWFVAAASTIAYELATGGQYFWDIVRTVEGRTGAISASPATDIDNEALKVVALSAAGGLDTVDLAAKSALVLVFDTKCGACKENMPRWIDLILDLRQRNLGVPVYALSLDSGTVEPLRYWEPLSRVVTVVKPLRDLDVQKFLGNYRVPATAVVRDGRVAVVHVGTIGKRRRSFILQSLGL